MRQCFLPNSSVGALVLTGGVEDRNWLVRSGDRGHGDFRERHVLTTPGDWDD